MVLSFAGKTDKTLSGPTQLGIRVHNSLDLTRLGDRSGPISFSVQKFLLLLLPTLENQLSRITFGCRSQAATYMFESLRLIGGVDACACPLRSCPEASARFVEPAVCVLRRKRRRVCVISDNTATRCDPALELDSAGVARTSR